MDGIGNSLVRLLDRATPLARPFAVIVVVASLFLAAWLFSRIAERVAAGFVDRAERRRVRTRSPHDTASISSLRQRETAIGLLATTARYSLFAVAIVLSLLALSGAQRLQTVVGASFLALIVGFAVQRFLMDVVSGLLMFFEGWFRIGDTVAVDPWKAQGIVEKVSLRSLTIRTVKGELIHIPNSQVLSLRVVPRGYRDVEVEFFASDLDAARTLVEAVARIVPSGPTRFLRRPEMLETERLDDDLYRITLGCAVAVGREWLAEDFLPTLIKERADDRLLVHGPIVTFVSEQAVRSFSRATARAPQRQHPRRSGPTPAVDVGAEAVGSGDTSWPASASITH
jgi:small-conductance mechanosensitive channel